MNNVLTNLENAAKYEGIENRICEIDMVLPENPNLSLKGRFFYLKFRDKIITEKEFAKFVYDKIVRFCIPRKKFQEAFVKTSSTGDERYLIDIYDQARHLFVKSIKEHGAHLGEPGELIEFVVLEAFFNAPQIASKMYLKTSENMPVHGSDSVHIRYVESTDSIEILWGESKLYQQISKAFDEIISSIANFTSSIKGRMPKDRDIDIIKDMPNVTDSKMEEALCEYFDPYSERSNKWSDVFCCLAGFDYDIYNKLKGKSNDDVEQYFRNSYMNKIVKSYALFSEKIEANGLRSLNFNLILLPFKSVKNFRREFFTLLDCNELLTEDAAL